MTLMMLVVLVVLSFSSLVLADDVSGVINEPTQEEKTALKHYIASLNEDAMKLSKCEDKVLKLQSELDKVKNQTDMSEEKRLEQSSENEYLSKEMETSSESSRGREESTDNMMESRNTQMNCDCELRDRECISANDEKERCQRQLRKNLDDCFSNNSAHALRTVELQECRHKKSMVEKKYNKELADVNEKLNNSNNALVDLEATLNEKNIQIGILNTTVEELKKTRISSTQEPDMMTREAKALTTPPTSVQGCEVFEKPSPAIRAFRDEMGIIVGDRQYIADYNVKKHTWEEAREYCNSRGMTLLQLESEQEFNNVVPRLQTYKFRAGTNRPKKLLHIWLGSRRDVHDRNSTFVWNCGSTPVEVVNYAATRPANHSQIYLSQHPCLSLRFFSLDLGGSWLASPCQHLHNTVCEKLII